MRKNPIKLVPRKGAKVNLVRYADDFVITAATRELLEDTILPVVVEFLATRGLAISPEKTHIVHIEQGFDFLGFNVRKYDGKLSIRPAKKNVLSFMRSIREFIRSQVGAPTAGLLARLNAKIRGWGNYYRHVISSKTFSRLDWQIAQALTRWIRRRHKKSKTWNWRRKHYYRQSGNTWLFSTTYRLADGRIRILDLFQLSSIKWTPHIKVRAIAHAFDPDHDAYFAARKRRLRYRVRVERQLLVQDRSMTSPIRTTLQQPGRFGDLSKMLEPYDGKLSRTVLRGEGGRKAPDLPGAIIGILIITREVKVKRNPIVVAALMLVSCAILCSAEDVSSATWLHGKWELLMIQMNPQRTSSPSTSMAPLSAHFRETMTSTGPTPSQGTA